MLDALITWLDNRRLERALRTIGQTVGPFPVNTNPSCLSNPGLIWPDIDVVYIASKREVAAWAEARNHRVNYPMGVSGHFRLHSFVEIVKTQKPA